MADAVTHETNAPLGFTLVADRLLEQLQKKPCECCEAIYKDEIAMLREALGQISRMKADFSPAINQTTLVAALTIARRAVAYVAE